MVQRLNAFDNPEGSIFSADGKFVFVSNSAELGMPDKGFHWTHKAGYISELTVQPDGTLKMVNEKLVTGLTGPLGKMRAGSSAAAAAGVVATLGNALTFDKEGNLYAIDAGIAGGTFSPPISTKGGEAYTWGCC